MSAKTLIHNTCRQHEDMLSKESKEKLPHKRQKAMMISAEKGASSWLTTLPITEHGFALHKGAFRDALCLCNVWHPPLLPSHCVCSQGLTVEHALSCSRGGFPSIRHNEIRDLTAELMSEVCYGVGIEPGLQPITEEHLSLGSANKVGGAWLYPVYTGLV